MVVVSFNKTLEEFHLTLAIGNQGVSVFFDDFRADEKYGTLALRHLGQIVVILSLRNESDIAHTVLARLEEIRKQDEAPEVLTVDGADSSLGGVA